MNHILPNGELVTTIHFAFQTNPTKLACMPNMVEFGETVYHPVVPHTNDVRAATCPSCKKSDVYKRSLDILNRNISK